LGFRRLRAHDNAADLSRMRDGRADREEHRHKDPDYPHGNLSGDVGRAPASPLNSIIVRHPRKLSRPS
jgi:hypothetical protein